MDTVLELAPGAKPSDEEEEEATPSYKRDYTGYVLALNGHKKYFCLFRPVFTGDEPDCGRSSDEDGGGTRARSRGGSRQRASTLQTHHKLDRLSLWMERLLEGTLPRHYVPAWPDLDTITPHKWRHFERHSHKHSPAHLYSKQQLGSPGLQGASRDNTLQGASLLIWNNRWYTVCVWGFIRELWCLQKILFWIMHCLTRLEIFFHGSSVCAFAARVTNQIISTRL